jgi:hypothetical protein
VPCRWCGPNPQQRWYCPKYLEQAGIEGATVHTMRHTFATSGPRFTDALSVFYDSIVGRIVTVSLA